MASSAENWQRLVRAALERDRVVDLVSAVPPLIGSTTSIEHVLQAAEDIQNDDPNIARILCEQAYTMAQDLDRSSAGTGVLLFKTALESVVKQKRARKDGASIYIDMEVLWNFYLEYKSRRQFAEIQRERERMRESATFSTEMGARAAEIKSIYATLWALLDALEILLGQAPTHRLARQIREEFSEMEHEEQDEYLRVVRKTFRTEDEGYQFYNEYAKAKGFSVRKEVASTRFRRLYTCFKEGHRSLANFDRPDPRKIPKAQTRCGCRAHLEIELNAATRKWFVKKFQAEHNHQLAKEGQSVRISDDPLLKNAARIYTPEMFKMVKEQFVKSEGWEIGEMIQEDETLVNFLVSSEWGEHDVRCVFVPKSLDSVSCHCRKMEREEIPCAHVFCVLKHYGMRDIPPCCVAARWTMEAKNAFEPDRIGSTHVCSEQMDRFHELCDMCNTAMFKVSMSTEKSERVKALLKSIIDEDAENEENADIVTTSPPLLGGGGKCLHFLKSATKWF